MSDYSVKADFGLNSVSGVVSSLPGGYALGDRRSEADGDRYVLVYNACNQQVSKGYGMARNVGSAAGNGPYSVTVTSTTEVAFNMVGVCVHATMTTGTYGWALVENAKSAIALNAVTAVAGGGTYIHPAGDGQFANGTTASVGYCATTSTTDTTDGGFYVAFDAAYTSQ